MLNYLRTQTSLFYQRFLARRIPVARTVTLDQRRIFIFPSRAGFMFLLLLLVMLITAINFQNNMAFALVFMLASLFFVTIYHSYANLSGLRFQAVDAKPGFVGDSLPFTLLVSRSNEREYHGISCAWPAEDQGVVSLVDAPSSTLTLHIKAKKRGRYVPPRVLIQSYFPLGLFRTWSWVALDINTLVYPQPVKKELKLSDSLGDDSGESTEALGSDDFYGLREYQLGDPLKHLSWKNYAKGLSLQTKEFNHYIDQHIYLDWNNVEGDIEHRLSVLCYWVLLCARRNNDFGLRLLDQQWPPGSGEQHTATMLAALASFGEEQKGDD